MHDAPAPTRPRVYHLSGDPLPPNIRPDRYTAARWHDVPEATRSEIVHRIPAGHVLHITHGGNRYSAALYLDGSLVTEHRQSTGRIGSTCLGLLHGWEWRDTTVTTDGVGS